MLGGESRVDLARRGDGACVDLGLDQDEASEDGVHKRLNATADHDHSLLRSVDQLGQPVVWALGSLAARIVVGHATA